MRRRVTTLITALVLTSTPVALVLPVPAAYAASAPTITSAYGTSEDGGHRIKVNLSTDMVTDRTIERVRATVRHPDGSTTPLDDFEIVRSTAYGWVATARTLVDASAIGDHVIDVSVWDSSGAQTDRATAGIIRQRLKTWFEGVTVNPTEIDAVNDEVTVSGRLLRHTVDGAEEPYPGATVKVAGTAAAFITDAQGAFSGKVSMGGLTFVIVSLAPGPVYANTSISPITLTYRALPTRVSLSAAFESQPQLVGGGVTLSGVLERRRPTGEWEPLSWKPLDISFWGLDDGTSEEIGHIYAGADGRFSVPTTIRGSGTFVASFNQEGPSDHAYLPDADYVDAFSVSQPTQIIGSDATPEPVGQGSKVSMSPQVIRPNAAGDRTNAVDVPVQLLFPPDGTTWLYVASGRTNAQGQATMSGTATVDGYWRLTYNGGAEGNAYASTPDVRSLGEADYVDVN